MIGTVPSRQARRIVVGISGATGFAYGVCALRLLRSLGLDAAEVSAAGNVCGPAVAEHGHEFVEVAAIPGWQEYDFPELRNRSPVP